MTFSAFGNDIQSHFVSTIHVHERFSNHSAESHDQERREVLALLARLIKIDVPRRSLRDFVPDKSRTALGHLDAEPADHCLQRCQSNSDARAGCLQ